MTLEIKRTPDSVKLTDTDVRDAIVDYVERNARRLILNPHSDGIHYHATNKGEARSGRDCDTVFATVQLQDPKPTPYAHDARPPSLADELDDVVAQLKRYGGEPKLRQIVEVIAVLALINDDVAHSRAFDFSQFYALNKGVRNLRTACKRTLLGDNDLDEE